MPDVEGAVPPPPRLPIWFLLGQWTMIRHQDKPMGARYVVVRVAAGRLIADSIVDEPAHDCHVLVAFR